MSNSSNKKGRRACFPLGKDIYIYSKKKKRFFIDAWINNLMHSNLIKLVLITSHKSHSLKKIIIIDFCSLWLKVVGNIES